MPKIVRFHETGAAEVLKLEELSEALSEDLNEGGKDG